MIVGKEYLGNLEDRLKAVEEEIISLRSSRPVRQLRFEEHGNSARDETPSRPSNHEGLEVNSNDLHDNMVAEDVTDGMGAAIFSEEEDFGFFGNIALTPSEILIMSTKLNVIRPFVKHRFHASHFACSDSSLWE
jgi:hypothetical protein